MEPDFSGYATKANLRCSDGRTIMPDAFKDNHGTRVPLVWQHGHSDPSNILGHAILENRSDGVYAYAFLNDTPAGQNVRKLIRHGDIRAMSIYANKLVEQAKSVFHGVIREVSLVLSGANPGALIDNISFAHSDGEIEIVEDEAIIYTGIPLGLGFGHDDSSDDDSEDNDSEDDDSDYEDYLDELNDLSEEEDDDMPDIDPEDLTEESTLADVWESLTDIQQDVVSYMIGEAIQDAESEMAQSGIGLYTQEEMDMARNVFEQQGDYTPSLSHEDMEGIVADAVRTGSLRAAVENFAHATDYGIENIDILFPDARSIMERPEFVSRRMAWVTEVLGGTRHSPFSRIKTLSADITHDEARALGYIKGNMKKEEFFSVAKRVTTPTTIYKKQKLDRDDILDITDFDVVAWIKAEMRLMLDEEIARAILFGDGRDVSSDDKISETNIRPIAKEADLYVHKFTFDPDASGAKWADLVDAILLNRPHYRGTGSPTLFTTEAVVTNILLTKANDGRRLYRSVDEIASEMRVAKIVPVEAMESVPDLLGVIVNLTDYTVGADKGGNISMFDDFDIDYNQFKYLMETRISGALTKVKSAIVINKPVVVAGP
jgi:HK97 family phage prohead protease